MADLIIAAATVAGLAIWALMTARTTWRDET